MMISHPVLFAAAVGGTAGLAVASVLVFLFLHGSVPVSVVLTLWPASILGLFDLGSGSTPLEAIKVVGTFGGNMAIYAVVASAAVGGVIVVKDFFDRKSSLPPSIK